MFIRGFLVLCLLSLTGCVVEAPPATQDVEEDAGTALPGADGSMMGQVDAQGAEPDAAPPSSCGNEDELNPNQTIDDAAAIEVGFGRNDLFICPQTSDWFVLSMTEGQNVSLKVVADPPETDLDLAITDATGEVIVESTNEEGLEEISFEAPADGDYFIRVDGYMNEAAFYGLYATGSCRLDSQCPDGQICNRFENQCEPAPMSECGVDDNEPNDQDFEATPIEAPLSIGGVLCGADHDWFAFTTDEGDSLELLVSFPDGEDIDVFVLDATTGQAVASATSDRRINPERLTLSHLPAGEYIVGLTLFIGEGDRDHDAEYVMEMSLESGGCEIDRDCRSNGLPRCVDGSCQPVEDAGLVPPGGQCSEDEDCGEGSEFCWTGGDGGHDNICSRRCQSNEDCSDIGGPCTPVSRRLAVCTPGCSTDDDCGIFYTCSEGICDLRGPCRTDDDCDEGTICRPTRTGDRYCSLPAEGANCGEDEDEPNDVSAEAVRLRPGEPREELNICNSDDDWYYVAVPADSGGSTMTISVEFRAGVDIDVYVFDTFGNPVGEATSPDRTEEVVELIYIQPGDYTIRVDQFSSDRLQDTSYTISAELVEPEERCTVEGGQCRNTEPLRMVCDELTGGCYALEGNGTVELGGDCDSQDDCVEEAEFCWTWEGGGRYNVCTIRCNQDNDCAGIEGTTCTIFMGRFGACLPPR